MGEADLMAAGGTETAVTILTMTAFYRMGALAVGYNDHPQAASRPFDVKRSGFVMSEGCGILVLEELDPHYLDHRYFHHLRHHPRVVRQPQLFQQGSDTIQIQLRSQ